MTLDAIVVGSGPAGGAAALSLARSGARVLLLERCALPRDKVCGDRLSPRALHVLRQLGFDAPRSQDVSQLILGSDLDSGYALTVPLLRGQGAIVRRSDLDWWIASNAAAAGAELRTNTEVDSLLIEDGVVCGVRVRSAGADAEDVRAPITLLAEGSSGRLTATVPGAGVGGDTRAIGIRCYLDEVRWSDPPAFEVRAPIVDDGFPVIGHGWISPVSDSCANIGMAVYAQDDGPASLAELLDRFIAGLIATDRRFLSAKRAGEARQAVIIVGRCASPKHIPGLLLLGDCAGVASPFSGEGISQALESGIVASETVLRCLGGNGALSDYAATLDRLRLSHARLTPSLPIIYAGLRNVARDFLPMLNERTALSRAFHEWVVRETSPRSESHGETATNDPLPLVVRAAEERARRLGSRDRVVFRSLLDHVESLRELPPSTAETFLRSVRSSHRTIDLETPELLKAATCMALLRLAAFLLDDLDVGVPAPQPDGSRGGPWLAATLSLAVADRLLGRCFWVCNRLPVRSRCIVAEAIVDLFEALASESAIGERHAHARLVAHLEAIATRAGSQLGATLAAEELATELGAAS